MDKVGEKKFDLKKDFFLSFKWQILLPHKTEREKSRKESYKCKVNLKKWWKHTAKGAREGEKPKGERKLEKWVQQKHHSGFFVHKKLNLSLSLSLRHTHQK